MPTPIFEEIEPAKVETTRPDPGQTDFAALLSRVYHIAAAAVTELELTDDPSRIKALNEKIGALSRLAKTLPLLQKAEQNTHVRDKKNKVLADWSTEELREAWQEMQVTK